MKHLWETQYIGNKLRTISLFPISMLMKTPMICSLHRWNYELPINYNYVQILNIPM